MNKKTATKILKKVITDYDMISQEFSQTRQHGWKEFEKYLPHLKKTDKIVDLGCGNGRFFTFLKKHGLTNYIGIDNNQKFLDLAKIQQKEARFIKGDLAKTPLANKSQNVATAIASFHHLPTVNLRKKSLREIQRILKANGTLIISVWNLFQPKYKKYIWISRLMSILSLGKYAPRDTFIPWGKTGVKRYYYAFTQKELQDLLENSNFKVVKQYLGNNIVMICRKIK